MGKRSSQRKKGPVYDSDDDDSASSSSTARSDLTLAQGVEDVQVDDDSVLEQALDALQEKRGSTREKALSLIIEVFGRNLQHQFVENKFFTLLSGCLNSVKRGSSIEKSFACQAIGLLALTVGVGDVAHEILEESVPIFFQALKTPSESSPALLECLAIITFVGGKDPEETERSMRIMWQLVHPKLGSNVVAKKCPAAVVRSMVSAWAFLLTTMERWTMSSNDWRESISYLSTLLDKDDRLVRIAAGEALALIFETDDLEKFGAEAKGFSDSISIGNDSKENIALIRGLKRKIVNQVKDLAAEAGGKGSTKKDLNNQRFVFRDVLEFFEYGSCPESSVKIGADVLRATNWNQVVQLNFLKHFLGGAFVKHMQENEFLQDVFEFAPRRRISQYEKKFQHSVNTAYSKERTVRLNRQRMLSQGYNVGHYAIGAEDE